MSTEQKNSEQQSEQPAPEQHDHPKSLMADKKKLILIVLVFVLFTASVIAATYLFTKSKKKSIIQEDSTKEQSTDHKDKNSKKEAPNDAKEAPPKIEKEPEPKKDKKDSSKDGKNEGKGEAKKEDPHLKVSGSHIYYTLSPEFVVNLSGAESVLLVVEIVLYSKNMPTISFVQNNLPLIQNSVFTTLSLFTGEELKSAEGKLKLMNSLKDEINKTLKDEQIEPAIEKILFTHFVMEI